MVCPFVDILKRKSKTDEGRQTISSFDPDIFLAVKASLYAVPVIMRTTGGAGTHADPRRMSILAALEFSERNGLKEIVADATNLK